MSADGWDLYNRYHASVQSWLKYFIDNEFLSTSSRGPGPGGSHQGTGSSHQWPLYELATRSDIVCTISRYHWDII